MQIVLLTLFALITSSAAVFSTQHFLEGNRGKSTDLCLVLCGICVCLVFSVLADCVIRAGSPTFYYHTHSPGRATVKIFGAACFCGGAVYALILMAAERKKLRDTVARRLFQSFLIAFCGAVILEIGYFNYRHFELIGAGTEQFEFIPERVLPHGFYFNRASRKFHPYYWTSDRDLEIYTGYRKVRNITYEFDDGSPKTRVQLGFNDRAHWEYEWILEHEFIQGVPRSFSIPLHTVGVTYSMMLRLPDAKEHDGSAYGISLPLIAVNRIVPLEIRPVRFGICFWILFFLSALFPGSPLWQVPLNFHDLYQTAAVAGLLLGVGIAFAWTVFSSYTGSELSVTEQKAALNENYQQYNKLVDALMVPRYALLDIPHHNLEQIDDVYDLRQREKKGDYDYLWDTAYYEGKYYVYFGVVPAVTVMMPYKLLTGDDLDLDYPILGFCCLFVIGLYGVYSQIVSRYFSKTSFGTYWTGLLLLLTALNLTWCLRRTLVYELAVTSGICFAVWGIFFISFASGRGKLKPLCFFLSGACSALAVGCRPTMLFVSIVVFTIAFCDLKASGEPASRKALHIMAFLVPYTLAGLALMKYNYERFGDPFEFGITYQLTTENRATGLPLLGFSGRILSILSSLFTFPSADMNFPFIHLRKPDLPYNGVILNSDTVLGVFAYPLTGFLFFLPFFRKRLSGHGRGLTAFCVSCLISAAGICITASDYAIFNRYLTDYLFLIALAAVIALFCIYETCENTALMKPFQTVILISAVIGLAYFAVLAVTGEGNWFNLINPLSYERLKYDLSPWL